MEIKKCRARVIIKKDATIDGEKPPYPYAVIVTNDGGFYTDVAYCKTRKKARKIQARIKKALP